MKGWPWSKTKVLSPLEGYNRWAATYQTESNPIKNLSDELVKKFLPDLAGKVVLDAGCGTGTFCSLAEKHRASKVVGLDLSPAMIAIAKANCSATEFRNGDLSNIASEDETYDAIICALVLGHLEFIEPALKSLLKALKKDGVLIITDFHPFLTLLQSKRTFKDVSSGKHFEVRHHLHLFQEYFNIVREHRAAVEALEEPLFNRSPVVFGMLVRKK